MTPEKQPTYVVRERERGLGMLVPNMHFASDKWRDKLGMLWFIKSQKIIKIFRNALQKICENKLNSFSGERKESHKEKEFIA